MAKVQSVQRQISDHASELCLIHSLLFGEPERGPKWLVIISRAMGAFQFGPRITVPLHTLNFQFSAQLYGKQV